MTESHPTGTLIGTLLVRVLVPAHVLFGAIMKFMNGSPDSLPHWIIAQVQNAQERGWNPYTEQVLLPEDAEAMLLMTVLKVILSIEFLAVGVMLLVRPLARPVAIAMLALFSFVLIAEIWYVSSVVDKGFLAVAFGEDCGCFGDALAIPAGVMLLIDLALCTLVLIFKPLASQKRIPSWAPIAAVLWAIASVTAGFNPPEPDPGIHIPWNQRPTHHWVDHPFDETPFAALLANELGVYREDYGPTKQVWVFYRRTCGMCHALFEEKYAEPPEDLLVIAVHVPAAPGSIAQVPERDIHCPDCVYIELPEGKDYSYDTPMEMYVDENGIITKVINRKLQESGQVDRDI